MDAVDIIIERTAEAQNGRGVPVRAKKFTTYAVSNFRGGIGKSTLSFNLAYEISINEPILILDLCPQRNMSQSLLGENLSDFDINIYDALISEVTGTGTVDYDEIIIRVSTSNPSFTGSNRKKSSIIPGSQELFLFPSLLYSQLAQFSQLSGIHGKAPSARVLNSIRTIVSSAAEKTKSNKVLIDTSPFFGGATHLAWCAADALIIPVRVDQHSIEALKLTLEMLSDKNSDFHKFNRQADLENVPKVHAIVMTHCGWSRQTKNKPDNSTRYFLQKALEISKQHEHLFSEEKAEDCFYLLDDFLSSGRISGKQRIPLAKLEVGRKFTVDGQRLEVNPAVERYKKEMKNLANSL